MSKTAAQGETPNQPAPVEFWERATVLRYFGGDRPLHTSTLYRGIRDQIYPRPVNVSRSSVRWLASECRAAAQAMLAARDEPKQATPRRGRPRRRISL